MEKRRKVIDLKELSEDEKNELSTAYKITISDNKTGEKLVNEDTQLIAFVFINKEDMSNARCGSIGYGDIYTQFGIAQSLNNLGEKIMTEMPILNIVEDELKIEVKPEIKIMVKEFLKGVIENERSIRRTNTNRT